MSNNRNRRNRTGQPHRPQGQAKAATGTAGAFTFTHQGRTYHMPPAQRAMEKVPAGVFIDALTAEDKNTADQAEMQFGMRLLQAVADELDPAAMNALRAKNMIEFGRIIGAWMQASGVAPGESERSSA